MKSAETLQLQHKLRPALRARLLEVTNKKDNATWRELQQIGVLLSELAERHYQVFGRLTSRRQRQLLHAAYDFFGKATQAAKKDPQLTTQNQQGWALAAISFDRIMAMARLARVQRNTISFVGEAATCDGLLQECIKRAECEEAATNLAFGHQAGIASMFRLRLAAGKLFGFPSPTEPGIVAALTNDAKKYLDVEASLDKRQAYRSYMMYLAMYQFGNRDWASGRASAKIAYRSAKQHNDAGHAVRAGLIMLFGRFGNRLAYALGMLRDSLKQG